MELQRALDKIAKSQQILGDKLTRFYLPNCDKHGLYKPKQVRVDSLDCRAFFLGGAGGGVNQQRCRPVQTWAPCRSWPMSAALPPPSACAPVQELRWRFCAGSVLVLCWFCLCANWGVACLCPVCAVRVVPGRPAGAMLVRQLLERQEDSGLHRLTCRVRVPLKPITAAQPQTPRLHRDAK